MSAADRDRTRWAELAAAATRAASDPAEAAPGLHRQAAIAHIDWMIPAEGKAPGYAFLAFCYACKAYGGAPTVKLRCILADGLRTTASAVQELLGPAADPPQPAPARLPYRDDQ